MNALDTTLHDVSINEKHFQCFLKMSKMSKVSGDSTGASFWVLSLSFLYELSLSIFVFKFCLTNLALVSLGDFARIRCKCKYFTEKVVLFITYFETPANASYDFFELTQNKYCVVTNLVNSCLCFLSDFRHFVDKRGFALLKERHKLKVPWRINLIDLIQANVPGDWMHIYKRIYERSYI